MPLLHSLPGFGFCDNLFAQDPLFRIFEKSCNQSYTHLGSVAGSFYIFCSRIPLPCETG